MTSEQLLIQFEKEERRERNVKILALILFFLTMTFALLSFALRPVTAEAKTISTVYNEKEIHFTIPDNIYNDNPYVYVVSNWYSLNHRYEYYAICSPQRLYTNRTDTTDLSNLPLCALGSFDYYMSYGVPCNDSESVFDFSDAGFGKWSFNKSNNFVNKGSLVAANNNIYVCDGSSSDGFTATSKLFFRVPEVPIARLAVELPEVVAVNLKVILPIAVFCLACLIGLVGLKKGLRTFQH